MTILEHWYVPHQVQNISNMFLKSFQRHYVTTKQMLLRTDHGILLGFLGQMYHCMVIFTAANMISIEKNEVLFPGDLFPCKSLKRIHCLCKYRWMRLRFLIKTLTSILKQMLWKKLSRERTLFTATSNSKRKIFITK